MDLINGDSRSYKERYLKEFHAVVEKISSGGIIPNLRDYFTRVSLPAWDRVEAVSRNEFDEIQTFLLDNGLSVNGAWGRENSGTGDYTRNKSLTF